MKIADINIGERYETKVGIYWKQVTIEGVAEHKHVSSTGRVTRLYFVRSPAGNLLRRHNGQLRRVTGERIPRPRVLVERAMSKKVNPVAAHETFTQEDQKLLARMVKRRKQYLSAADLPNLAHEFGISYDKTAFLFKRYREELEKAQAKKTLGIRQRAAIYLIEDLCDEND